MTIEDTKSSIIPFMGYQVLQDNTESNNHHLPIDILIKLFTVMAIRYTEEGKNSLRLGDRRSAKIFFQKAIEMHNYNRYLLEQV